MIDLGLSEEQQLIQDSAHKFAYNEIASQAAAFDVSSDFPEDLIKAAEKLGFINITIPDTLGGTGLSNIDACLVVEELAAGCGGIATSCVANDLALSPIIIGGSDEQKEAYVKKLIAKQSLASFCLSEPGAGSDVAGMSTRLEKVKGGYRLTGAKQWITNGGYADQYTVFATLDKSLKHKGICCVVVPADSEGVSTGPHEDKLGQRASNTTTVNFDNVFIPEAQRIGEEGEGFTIAMKTLDHTRPLTAVIAVGIARRAFECACAYAKERKQFGKPIADFQAIQIILADMATDIEAARLLTFKCAWRADAGLSSTLNSSMAKRFAADMAMRVTTDAVQVYGGYGYTKEYPVEKLMRDAKLMQIYEGTSQIQRIVIAREVLKDL
jgi:acyl-CoA dehydrogenase